MLKIINDIILVFDYFYNKSNNQLNIHFFVFIK